jgi:serine/threonine protein kinase
VYIADFGLGKLLTNICGAGRTTMQAGTPAFQPPEQLMGEACGVGSDVYAMGCIMVESSQFGIQKC